MEVEPFDQTQLEDLGLNTCNHDIPLNNREIPSVDELEPQLLPNFSPLDVNLGDKRGTDQPINPYSLGSFRMKKSPATLHDEGLKNLLQTVETTSGFHATPSGLQSDGVKIIATTSELSQLKEILEDST
ncbi:hypothetical protein Tco_0517161 [Tanacetum coccineum]